jgi:fructuronate reductase
LAEEVPTTRLCAETVGRSLPYDRSRVTPGIVHLGVGAFCRAHMAAYVNDLLGADSSWGIVGASLRRPDTRDALAPQDFLYTIAERSGAGTATKVIGSLVTVLDAATQRGELTLRWSIRAFASSRSP